MTAQVPESWRGSRVDLHWDARCEGLLRLAGVTVQGLNIGRHQARLIAAAEGGEVIEFEIEVASNRDFGQADDPGLAPAAVDPYRLVACELRRFDPDAWALFHDFETLRALEADREPAQKPLSFGGVAPKIVRPALDTTWAGRLLHELNRVCNDLIPEDPSTWGPGREIPGRPSGGAQRRRGPRTLRHRACPYRYRLALAHRGDLAQMPAEFRQCPGAHGCVSGVQVRLLPGLPV